MQPRFCETIFLVCDGDLVGLASGFVFRKHVRGATGVHDLELCGVVGGISAPVRHQGASQVFSRCPKSAFE